MPPAKLACQGCRLSKVKCDLEHRDTGVCSRCARLGLRCLPTGPSKRGRPHTARDISRLGPKVRQLLVKRGELPPDVVPVQDDDEEAYVGPTDIQTSVTPHRRIQTPHGQVELCHMNFAVRNLAETILKKSLVTPGAKKAWTRHVVYITQRSRNIGACPVDARRAGGGLPPAGSLTLPSPVVRAESMAHALLLAKEMGFTMDDVEGAMRVIDPCRVPAPEPLPEFLTEWYVGDQVSLTRVQNEGYMEWLPSAGFERAFGVEGKLDAGMLTMLDNNEDRAELCTITGRLWAQVTDDASPGVAQHVQVEGDKDLFMSVKGITYGPFRMRGRLVVRDQSSRTWTCINLAPASHSAGMLRGPSSAGGVMHLDVRASSEARTAPHITPVSPGTSGTASFAEVQAVTVPVVPVVPAKQSSFDAMFGGLDADRALLEFLDNAESAVDAAMGADAEQLPLEQLLALVQE